MGADVRRGDLVRPCAGDDDDDDDVSAGSTQPRGGLEQPCAASDDDDIASLAQPLTQEHDHDRRHRRHVRKAATMTATAVTTGLALVGAAATAWSSARGRLVQKVSTSSPQILVEEANCHTAVTGEDCHTEIIWAMDMGMKEHRRWYKETCPRLTEEASFEEFQVCLHRMNKCPLPCDSPDARGRTEGVIIEQTGRQQAWSGSLSQPCHMAKQGESCYETVIDSMLRFTTEGRSDLFPGLTVNSLFEEFQLALFESTQDDTCPKPCQCHTAQKGDACFDHVVWAMSEGIKDHPTWYGGLNGQSTFEEVQAYMHEDSKDSCPLPCSNITVAYLLERRAAFEGKAGMLPPRSSSGPSFSLEAAGPSTVQTLGKTALANAESAADDESPCQAVKKGSHCYNSVVYGMTKGLKEHPEWYSGLDSYSSFEDFQRHLIGNPGVNCPPPCPCKTARLGDECHKNVRWVLQEGLPQHPGWYPNLTETSRWEDVQQRVFEDETTTCQRPCQKRPWGDPSIFCWSVFRSSGYEVDLVTSQVEKGVGIFSCDDFSVLSDKELQLSAEVKTLIMPPSGEVGVSKDGTAANTLIFIQAWGVIWRDARWQAHDWVLKADPDAVVIVDRLRNRLGSRKTENVWIKNCMKYEGPGWPMMFGSLEAFSHGALKLYFNGADRCQRELDWDSWGEDLYMGKCLDLLGAPSEFDGTLVGDNVCKGADCSDGVSAAYHPFKSREDWLNCYNQASR